jgi:iron-sulfur cluster repair protein YtfE (RIC family)
MENIQDSTSAESIIAAVKRLPLAELEQLVDQVIAIRAERRAPHLTADESALLSRINQGLSAQERDKVKALIAKRDDQTITPTELEELIALTDRLELLHADRLAALAELASLKGVTLDVVMSQLGMHFPDHD